MAQAKIRGFDAQGLATTVWAYATLNHRRAPTRARSPPSASPPFRRLPILGFTRQVLRGHLERKPNEERAIDIEMR